MKKLIFLTFFAVGFLLSSHLGAQDHFSTKIGKLVNGVPTITYDQTLLKQQWESFLSSNSAIQVTLSSVEIIAEGANYILKGSSADNITKTAVFLVLDGNDFYEFRSNGNSNESINPPGSVTCTGCNVGCDPAISGSNTWICWPTCYEGCTKSVTVSEFSVFGGGE